MLTKVLAVDVLDAAVLHNQLHVVTATNPDMAGEWSAREVATWFRTLCSDHALRKKLKIPHTDPVSPEEIAAALATPRRIAKWRSRSMTAGWRPSPTA
ncbi:MAG: hypothetical protein SGJ11_10590 [Phycisphaerae bacterium]|nr:hypothetical protein [Phycisphaerae bacterium]